MFYRIHSISCVSNETFSVVYGVRRGCHRFNPAPIPTLFNVVLESRDRLPTVVSRAQHAINILK